MFKKSSQEKTDNVHPLKVKEALSSVDKSTIENLDLPEASRNEDRTKFQPVSRTQGTLKTGDVCEP